MYALDVALGLIWFIPISIKYYEFELVKQLTLSNLMIDNHCVKIDNYL
jgi:hypothetical protein